MSILGPYKPKYETTVSGVAKQYPISSVVSLGALPLIGAAAGKVLETGRAMFSDTGDPLAMVKGRTQQVADDLSGYTNGTAGKPTISTPSVTALPKPTITPAATAATSDTGATGFGNVGIAKLRPQDLSRMSDGSLPPGNRAQRGKTAGITAAGNPLTPATQTSAAQPTDVAAQPANAIAPPMQTAGERIYEYKAPGVLDPSQNSLLAGVAGDDAAFDASRKQDITSGVSTALTPQEIKNYSIGKNGGIASMDGKTFVLPARGVDEEAAYQTEQAKNAAPLSNGIAALPAAPATTYGDSSGVYQLAPGQNPPQNTSDFSKMSLGDLAMAKFSMNQQAKQAGIANVGSEITHRTTADAMAGAELPSKISSNVAAARHLNAITDIAGYKAPAEVANLNAVTNQHIALTNETNKLVDLKAKNLISEADYRAGMLDIGNKKLDILTKQYDAKLAAMKNSKAEPDYKLLADISKYKVKAYQEMSALGGLTPEQKLDMDKHIKNLDIIQRHATKTATQYGGGAAAIADEES